MNDEEIQTPTVASVTIALIIAALILFGFWYLNHDDVLPPDAELIREVSSWSSFDGSEDAIVAAGERACIGAETVAGSHSMLLSTFTQDTLGMERFLEESSVDFIFTSVQILCPEYSTNLDEAMGLIYGS